jgi:predicted DNA-binding mobile mystery protein A
MTTGQLAKRMGVSQPRIVALEKAEASHSITLESLERAANALDCQVVYALIPRKPLDALVAERAERLAKQQLESTRHSMALENQSVESSDEKHQLRELVRQIAEKGGSKLWRDDE